MRFVIKDAGKYRNIFIYKRPANIDSRFQISMQTNIVAFECDRLKH